MKTGSINKKFDILRTLLAILISLTLAFIIILIVSDNPGNTLYNFLIGPITNFRRFSNVIELAIPLTFTGLAISIIFTSGMSNLAVEGAFYFSAAITTLSAVLLDLPPIIHPIVSLILGSLAGVFVVSIPSLLKVKWGADELVASLMLNYVALHMSTYLIRQYVLDSALGITASLKFNLNAKLPNIVPGTRLHLGLVFAVIAVLLVWLLLNKTKLGYEIRMVGKNKNFSKYTGIKVAGTIMAAQVIGGILAGFGGASEMLGMYNRFQYQGLTQYGFDGMIIAIIAKNNPAVVPFSAFFLAYIRIGADIMNRTSDVPMELISVIQAVIIMLIVAKRFLNKLQQKRIVEMSKNEASKEEVSN